MTIIHISNTKDMLRERTYCFYCEWVNGFQKEISSFLSSFTCKTLRHCGTIILVMIIILITSYLDAWWFIKCFSMTLSLTPATQSCMVGVIILIWQLNKKQGFKIESLTCWPVDSFWPIQHYAWCFKNCG